MLHNFASTSSATQGKMTYLHANPKDMPNYRAAAIQGNTIGISYSDPIPNTETIGLIRMEI
jgi:hypothetical protein